MAKESKQEDPESQGRTLAMGLLARREHSRQELARKLRQRRVPDQTITIVLDEFDEQGWLSDERFADVFARQRRDMGYGPLKISSDLQKRGVSLWPDCLAVMSEGDWLVLALQARRKKFGLGDISEDWPEKARQARFLGQRGFTGEQVERALEHAVDPDQPS